MGAWSAYPWHSQFAPRKRHLPAVRSLVLRRSRLQLACNSRPAIPSQRDISLIRRKFNRTAFGNYSIGNVGCCGRRWPLLFSYWWLGKCGRGGPRALTRLSSLCETCVKKAVIASANGSKQASSHTVKSALLTDVSGFLATLTRRSANEELIQLSAGTNLRVEPSGHFSTP